MILKIGIYKAITTYQNHTGWVCACVNIKLRTVILWHRNTEIIEHLRKLNERLTFKEVR